MALWFKHTQHQILERSSLFFHCFPLSSSKHADSIDLELEVDPLNVDHFSCTPLVRHLMLTFVCGGKN